MSSTDTTATFRYVESPYSKAPHFVLSDDLRIPGQSSRNSNLEFMYGPPALIKDIRTANEVFSLDTHGFRAVTHNWALEDWTDGEKVESEYFREVKRLLMMEFGKGVRVEIYNWRLRRSEGGSDGAKSGENEKRDDTKVKHARPLPTVHIDQTPKGMKKRVRQRMGDEADKILQGRVRMINIWRPINHPVTSWPLALCNGSTVLPSSLVPTDFITADYVGEMYYVTHHPDQEWYYLSLQKPEEVLLFKIADSREDVSARYCPHASFRPGGAERGRARESIEVRALIFGG